MAVNEPLSLLEPVDLPLRDDDLFYVVQSGLTSTSTASRQLTFLDFIGEISTSVTGIEVQLNGVPISDQSLLNLINTASVTWANAAGGEVRATAAGGGGSGALTLIEKKTITSNSTTVTFSGLDGNTDGVYLLIARVLNNSGTTSTLLLRPNGATTNLNSVFTAIGTTGTFPGEQTTWQIGNMANGQYNMNTVTIWAKANPNSVATPRQYAMEGGTFNGTNYLSLHGFGRWNETATNITSLDVVAGQANGIGDGSELALYKYAQS